MKSIRDFIQQFALKKGIIMENKKTGFDTIDEYIATFPEETQKILEAIRAAIRSVAPEAVEKISYQMPTFYLYGNLVHFAAFKSHIGLYPTPSGTEAFKKELSTYQAGKGSIRFPIDKPIPLDLIKEIVKYRVAENMKKAASQPKKKNG